MGWQTREHWRNGTHELWLREMWDVYSAGWRVEWNLPVRKGESFSNGRYEQPPDRDRHAAREVLARRRLGEKMTEVDGDWQRAD